MNKEIVVAAYDKPTYWLNNLNTEVKKSIYRKGNILPLSNTEILIEPNLGRCVHTFFNHIYTNYDTLSDLTFFVQDYPFDHWGELIEAVNYDGDIIDWATLIIPEGYYGFHNNKLGTSWSLQPSKQVGEGNILVCLSNGHPQDTKTNINVDKYWDIFFNESKPSTYEFIPGGHFAIKKEHAKLRTKEFYKKITDLLIDDATAPWIIERLECYIFNPNYKTNL